MIDLGITFLQLIGVLIWVSVMVPALILVGEFLFFNILVDPLMATNGGQYDPRAQAMEEVHFEWRCIVCCMVALSPLHLEQHLTGTESVYFHLDNTPWVKCNICHTPFHLQCGTWESVYVVRSRRFLCTFYCCRQF